MCFLIRGRTSPFESRDLFRVAEATGVVDFLFALVTLQGEAVCILVCVKASVVMWLVYRIERSSGISGLSELPDALPRPGTQPELLPVLAAFLLNVSSATVFNDRARTTD